MKTNKAWYVVLPILAFVVFGLLFPEGVANSQMLRNWIQNRRQARQARIQQRQQVFNTGWVTASDGQQVYCENGVCYTSPPQVEYYTPQVVESAFTSQPAAEYGSLPPLVETSYDVPVEVKEPGLRRSLLKAISKARKSGDITARDAVKLRVASFSPAFLEKAEELCVTQMAMSVEGGDYLEFNEDGTINKTAIDWEGLAGFLERILPLLLQLLKAFGL